MTNTERQLTLDTKMYRKKSYGKEDYCAYCFAKDCIKGGCIVKSKHRSKSMLCVKAECRMNGTPFRTTFQETIQYAGKRKVHRLCGLKKQEVLE
jgi:hypothetical protein